VASFFVSRVDTEADKRLDAVGRPELKGKLAIANAKLAYEHYLQVFASDRWRYLESKGATPQRCLWASTSTKNPEYRDVIYVEELIGPHTVNTMPEETMRAFQDHGQVRGDTVLEGWDEAHEVLAKLKEVGGDYADAVADEGLDAIVLLGMGGSSLAPEVIRRTFGVESFHVLDTTHPQAIRDLEASIEVENTLFISASKSGGTLETRSHTHYFW